MSILREKTIWPSFFYGMPGLESTKVIIFGLYANTYLLGHNYLKDIEAEELQRLVDVYDSNMAELNMDEQSLVLQIASDRYLKAVEIQIKNNTLTTKTKQLNTDEQERVEKLAALEVDQEALETKRVQIELAKDRAELKNKDLEARIQLEELAQDYVAVEISQKELEAAMSELKVLITALRGLEIQIDIANNSYRIVEVEATKSQYIADITEIDTQTAIVETSKQTYAAEILEIEIRKNELELSKKQYFADVTEINTKKAELELSKKEIASEIKYINFQEEQAETLQKQYVAEISGLNMQIEKLNVEQAQIKAFIIECDIKIEELETSKSQYDADIARIYVHTEEVDYISGSVSMLQKENEDEILSELKYRVNDSDLQQKKRDLIELRKDALEDEKDYIRDTVIAKEGEIKTEQKAKRVEQQTAIIQNFTDKETISSDFGTQDGYANDHKEDIALDKRNHRQALWDKELDLYTERKTKLTAISDASIEAAKTLATADIVTSLTHEIGGI